MHMKDPKKTVYLSGPIMDEHEGTAREWRESAKKMLGEKFHLLDPMRRKFVDRQVDSANEIVEFVASNLQVDMQSIGFDGPPVEKISARDIGKFFKNKKGLLAVICSEQEKQTYLRKAYNAVGEKGKVSKTKINFLTVYESKGLEFSCVAVIDEGMSDSERYIAYTRALNELAVVEEKLR